MDRAPGGFTISCRFLCSVLVVCPVAYRFFVADGDVYLFLLLVLAAPLAGLVLIANSLFCLFRYWKLEPLWVNATFLLIGMSGVLVAWHYIPQFRM
jgi:hypothetical protein